MTEHHLITREIGIDVGHRVTFHGSKCRNLHGHRYTVHATCKGPLAVGGEQDGMVLDFNFLKEEMMDEIDEPCDHGMTLWDQDPWVEVLCPDMAEQIATDIKNYGYSSFTLAGDANKGGKYYIVPFVPTAENLARHWFDRLKIRVAARTGDRASLAKIKVWETPNCSAEYPTQQA